MPAASVPVTNESQVSLSIIEMPVWPYSFQRMYVE